MHAIFMPWGRYEQMQDFLLDMRAQKHMMTFTSPDGKETKKLWIEGQLRILPFGIIEYVFPKEDMDIVLTTLHFHHPATPKLGNMRLAVLRQITKAEKAPIFETDKQYLWRQKFTGIIPIGIRYDDEGQQEENGELKGWTHEGI